MNQHHQKVRIPRYDSSFHSALMSVMLSLSLCLIPNALAPITSADTAFILTSFTPRHPLFLQKNLEQIIGQSEDILAALTIYLEARGESFAGKLAVAAVIRNRMNTKYHSDGSVKGTVLRAKQFEPWIGRNPEDVIFDQTNRKMQESLLAWKLVQDGRKIVDGAVLFYNPHLVKPPQWALIHRKAAKIGRHEFFHRHTI